MVQFPNGLLVLYTYRGSSFRKEFNNISEVRSLIPSGVKLMALTATATKTSRKEIMKSLAMFDSVVVATTPDKPNIKYFVSEKTDFDSMFKHTIEQIRLKSVECPRGIIFCSTIIGCSDVYKFFKRRLGSAMTHPAGSPDVSKFRLVDMFCSCTQEDVKSNIVESFSSSSGTLRLVIATIAFGMGVDCPNVRMVAHCGPSSNLEMYLQETGRAGRDGQPAYAVLYLRSTHLSQHVGNDMKEYCRSQDYCRRRILLKQFEEQATHSIEGDQRSCRCCDICSKHCTCGKCFDYDSQLGIPPHLSCTETRESLQ